MTTLLQLGTVRQPVSRRAAELAEGPLRHSLKDSSQHRIVRPGTPAPLRFRKKVHVCLRTPNVQDSVQAVGPYKEFTDASSCPTNHEIQPRRCNRLHD